MAGEGGDMHCEQDMRAMGTAEWRECVEKCPAPLQPLSRKLPDRSPTMVFQTVVGAAATWRRCQGHDQRTGQQERTEEAQCVDVGGGTTRAARPVTRRDQGSVAGLCGRDKCEGGMHVWHACLHFSYRHASCMGAWRKNAAALHLAKSSSIGRSPDNTMTQIRVDMQAARDWSTQAPAQV